MKRKNQDRKKGPNRTFGIAKGGTVAIMLLLIISLGVVGLIGPAETVEGDEQLQSTGISDWYDLDDIRNDMEGDYHLENDLDEDTAGYEDVHHDEYGFQPLGTNEDGSEHKERFDGSFDGQGHTIEGLWMDVYCRASLFASTEESVGFIGNFELTNFEIKSGGNVGAIIHMSRGNYVQDVSVNNGEIASTFENDDNMGGIVGSISNDEGEEFIWLKNSYVRNVDFVVNEADDVEDRRVGSLVGIARGIAENSYAIDNTLTTNDLEVSKSPLVGLEGTGFGSLDNCFYHEDMEEEFGDSESAVDLTDSEFTSYSTFDDWDITTVEPGETDDSYTWNIVDGETEPFLSFEDDDGDDDDSTLITDPKDYDEWTEWLMDNPLLVVLAVVFVILISRMASDEG